MIQYQACLGMKETKYVLNLPQREHKLVLGKKKAMTSTGSSMKYVKEVSTQTNLDENNDNDTLHFHGWTEFCSKLKDANQIGRFQNLVTAVGSEKLKTTNLAWKSCLDMGVLSNLKSTTSMHYDRECVEFFSLFYIMFGGSTVNVLRGTAHFGGLVEKDTYHGHYNPLKGSFSFAIPSLNTLRKIANGYPKNIDVSFIGHSLDMAQEQAQRGAQFVIGFDSKMVAQGCKGESNGDVNLWGCEKPSIAASLRNLGIRKYCAVDIQRPSSEEDKNLKLLKYQRLSLHMSRTLRQLHCSVTNLYRQLKN